MTPTTTTESLFCRSQLNTGRDLPFLGNFIALIDTTVCRGRTNGQWKRSHSVLRAELLPTGDLQKALADLFLHCEASYVSCVA